MDKERFWRSAVERQRGSGLSQQQFCRQEQLNPNTFSSWKQIIRERDAEAGRTAENQSRKRTPVRRTQKQKIAKFAPVVVRAEDRTETPAVPCIFPVEVHFGPERFIRIFEGTSAELLAAVFHALRLS